MNLKQKVIASLQKSNFPEFDFLFSDEVVQIAPELLNEFLEKEKQEFQDTLATPDSEISFETFEELSLLDMFWGYLEHSKSVNSNDTIRKIIEDFEPKLMDFANEVSYSKRYFEMYEYCINKATLDSEQTKIISDTVRNYKIRGINLDTTKQEELKQINKDLSELSTKFSNNSLDSENEFEYYIESDTDIKELPEDVLAGARKRSGNKPGYIFSSDPSEYIAIMKYCDDSNIRKDFYLARGSTASSGKYDNRGVVLDILRLKDKKAKLLGFNNYAELSLEFKMADTPEQILELSTQVAERARTKAKSEVEMLKKYFNLDTLNDWDTGYYMRKYKQDNFNLDDKILKPYFEYNNVLAGLHNIVEKLYGIQMKKTDIKSYHKDVVVYEVYKDEKLISYYFLDAFFRPEKRSGAWANNIRTTFKGSTPVVLNVCNFTPRDDNGLSLLTKSDVETIFHEFGHGLHEMSSKSQYSELSGFGVEWDFVEVPSQFMEHWSETKESLDLFAKHYKTGETIPEELLENMKTSSKIGNGLGVLGQCSYAIMDMQLHHESIPGSVEELDQKTIDITNKYSLNPKLPEYKMYASFGHIFAGGYSAGYYSYMWAEMLELDVWREFQKNGIFDQKTASNYFDNLLSAGSQLKAAEIFKNTMGREVDLEGFFEYKSI
ncbi:M3 family metallopeptidase [Candidatus Gracilibacteria bacterium]|nr:M3 family metallopeptidase [Candidatus Gracilibacteria bacterium]